MGFVPLEIESTKKEKDKLSITGKLYLNKINFTKNTNSLTKAKYNYSRLLGKFSRVTHPFATQAKSLRSTRMC